MVQELVVRLCLPSATSLYKQIFKAPFHCGVGPTPPHSLVSSSRPSLGPNFFLGIFLAPLVHRIRAPTHL